MALATLAARTKNTLPYRNLNHAKNEIRLASFLKPSEVDQAAGGICDLVCTVDVHSLADYNDEYVEFESQAPASWSESEKIEEWMSSRKEEYPVRYRWGDYLAMSHTWGDRSQTASVMVNGKVITISRNLAEGLRALSRTPTIVQGHLKFFNDFLCLDQDNESEIQHELKRMSTIFSSALAVMAWVGPSEDGSDAVMKTLQGLEDIGDYEKPDHFSLLESIDIDIWLPLLRFFQRPLWTRVWLVQELTLASARTSLLCGHQTVTLRALWTLASVIHTAASKAHLLLMSVAGNWADRDVERLQFFSTNARFYMLRQIATSVRAGRPCDTLMLMDVCRRSLQYDARDKVYDVLGLLPAAVVRLIEPDLNKEAHQVYADLVRAIVKATRKVDILQNCRIDWDRPVLPTWTPDLMQLHLSHVLGTLRLMYAGDGGNLEPRFSPDGQLLICKGFVLDTISHLTPPQSPLAPISQEERAQSTSDGVLARSEAEVQESLWTTLVGGSLDAHNEPAPEIYSRILGIPWISDLSMDVTATAHALIRGHWCPSDSARDLLAFLHFRQRVLPEFDLCGHSMQTFFPTTYLQMDEASAMRRDYHHAQLMTVILRQFSRTMKRRRLIVTSKGRLGAAVRQARKGDTIATVRNCNVPLILRRPPPDSAGRVRDEFMVVGDCYVHGLMNAEAIEQGIEEQDIVLC